MISDCMWPKIRTSIPVTIQCSSIAAVTPWDHSQLLALSLASIFHCNDATTITITKSLETTRVCDTAAGEVTSWRFPMLYYRHISCDLVHARLATCVTSGNKLILSKWRWSRLAHSLRWRRPLLRMSDQPPRGSDTSWDGTVSYLFFIVVIISN